jgi:hypothetical protein
MEPESSLPYSQHPAIRPYPEPDESSPYSPNPDSLRYILILTSHLHLGLSSGPFPLGFRTEIVYAFLIFPVWILLYFLPFFLCA